MFGPDLRSSPAQHHSKKLRVFGEAGCRACHTEGEMGDILDSRRLPRNSINVHSERSEESGEGGSG